MNPEQGHEPIENPIPNQLKQVVQLMSDDPDRFLESFGVFGPDFLELATELHAMNPAAYPKPNTIGLYHELFGSGVAAGMSPIIATDFPGNPLSEYVATKTLDEQKVVGQRILEHYRKLLSSEPDRE